MIGRPDKTGQRANRSRALRALDLSGRGLIALALGGLLFVGYQLWGTGFITAREQRELKASFRDQLLDLQSSPAATGASGEENPSPPPKPVPGDAVALLEIPNLSVEYIVVEGTGVADLRKGPGHYAGTALPGEQGNAAIAGHRTTYGAPFGNLDQLDPGDPIVTTTLAGRFTYRVEETTVVSPGAVEVLDPTPDARLTLTTCHPRYSARQRLVVIATLDEERSPEPLAARANVGSVPRRASLDTEASGAGRLSLATIAWGLVVGAVGIAWWAGYRRWRRWTTWITGAIPFLTALFVFYVQVERLLPANV